MSRRELLINVAAGRHPADLVLKNGVVFNVFTGQFIPGDVAIVDGYIAAVGRYKGKVEVDCAEKYLTPGFIDGHVHMESSMVSPTEFANAVLPWGTTTVIADPHEIANVAGKAGLKYMLKAAEAAPLNIYFMLPSCVPATCLETAGAVLTAADLGEFITHNKVIGLGEMMNYPGVIHCDREVLAKLEIAAERIIDGHGPGLTGHELAAYAAAGVHSDHECTTAEEALDRIQQGLYVMIREGTAAKNLQSLLPAVNRYTARRCIFVTDDRHPRDLIDCGHINQMIRDAIAAGVDMAIAIQMATINSAECFRLNDLGAIAPGYRADIVIFDDLTTWSPCSVYKDGKLAAAQGTSLVKAVKTDDDAVRHTVRVGAIDRERLRIPATSKQARVIELLPRQIVTKERIITPPITDGAYWPDPEQNLIKVAVLERHKDTGRTGVGLLYGLGLKAGAIASTIAHDSHNLIVAGVSDDDILLAAEEVRRMEGGLAVSLGGKVAGRLPLPLGGIMAESSIYDTRNSLEELLTITRHLGVSENFDPFLTLAFLSLPVVPELKLTDHGLVDVRTMTIVPVAVD